MVNPFFEKLALPVKAHPNLDKLQNFDPLPTITLFLKSKSVRPL
jgi:hypothetical protein